MKKVSSDPGRRNSVLKLGNRHVRRIKKAKALIGLRRGLGWSNSYKPRNNSGLVM